MTDFELPEELPMMTLSGMSMFPHAVTPLYIFEPRYRQMLEDVLASHRMFCVAGQNDALAESTGQFEPPYSIAAAGIIRASQKNTDETSHLMLQGLTRVHIEAIVQEDPYRIVKVRPLRTQPGANAEQLEALAGTMIDYLRERNTLTEAAPEELLEYFNSLDDFDQLADLSIFTFCQDNQEKQQLLETLETSRRIQLFNTILKRENEILSMEQQLRGDLSDDDILKN